MALDVGCCLFNCVSDLNDSHRDLTHQTHIEIDIKTPAPFDIRPFFCYPAEYPDKLLTNNANLE